MKRTELIYKYIKRIMIDYPEEDKLHIDLTKFAQEVLEISEDNKYFDLLNALKQTVYILESFAKEQQSSDVFVEKAIETGRKILKKYE